MNDVRGVDVSAIGQGRFDWHRWAGHIGFGIAKATEGTTFADPEFAHNWEAMGDLGLWRFAYHYFHPSVDPSSQAQYFLDIAGSADFHTDRDNLVIDLEDTDNMSAIDVSFAAWTFVTEINRIARDVRCVVYTYPYFASQGNCAQLGAWPLWIADYGVPTPTVPPPWNDWAIWQESAHSLGNKDVFNGGPDRLKKFCTTTGLWTG